MQLFVCVFFSESLEMSKKNKQPKQPQQTKPVQEKAKQDAKKEASQPVKPKDGAKKGCLKEKEDEIIETNEKSSDTSKKFSAHVYTSTKVSSSGFLVERWYLCLN